MPRTRSAVCFISIVAFAAGCRPQAADRSAHVQIGADAAPSPPPPPPPPPPPAPPPPDADPAPEPDAIAPVTAAEPPRDAAPVAPPDAAADQAPPADAAAPDLRPDAAVPDAPLPDAAPPSLVDSLLALTPATCATRLTPNLALQEPGGEAGTAAVCGLRGAAYWVADMDIACDGRNTPGKCDNGHDTDTFTHNARDQALASAVTPYVVVPSATPIPGLRPGAVVAVINRLDKKMVFAVFGDTDDSGIIGAASFACAEKLGINPDPASGGQRGRSVVYIAFTGAAAVPADVENQAQATALGQALAAQLISTNH